MIAIRLLLLTLSLYGLSRLAMRRLRLPVEGARPTMVSAATLTTLAGMLNLLPEAVWLLWGAGLVLAANSLWLAGIAACRRYAGHMLLCGCRDRTGVSNEWCAGFAI